MTLGLKPSASFYSSGGDGQRAEKVLYVARPRAHGASCPGPPHVSWERLPLPRQGPSSVVGFADERTQKRLPAPLGGSEAQRRGRSGKRHDIPIPPRGASKTGLQTRPAEGRKRGAEFWSPFSAELTEFPWKWSLVKEDRPPETSGMLPHLKGVF